MTTQNLNEYDSLFSPQLDMGGTSNSSTEEYQVGADKGKNGVYQSIIRFVPWHKNPNNSIIEKWVSWLVDPVTQKGRFVDCPSSIGKPSLLQDMYWKLKKSESVLEQKKADTFSRRHNFAALIQIIKDEQQPELEGKIMVYKFGKKIWEKINSELKPIIGDPHNPFDLLKGKGFHLMITKVSGFNNYDQSKFLDKVIPFCMPNPKNNKLETINGETDKSIVYKYLVENSPDLTKFGFKEWDQETYDYVTGVITAITGQTPKQTTLSNVNSAITGSNPTGKSNQKPGNGITATEISIDEISAGDINISDMPSIDLPELGSAPGIGGDLDDILNTL